ncbi:MAG: hypothetical protein HIU83_12340 [Proteobacteria bacterium]|nr:hypothetical protein [Pseudomonadota bacterium]
MKICITGNSARSCDRAMDDCVKCVPGGGVNVVEQLTTSEMAVIAGSFSGYANDLDMTIEWLEALYKRSKLGSNNKRLLRHQFVSLNRLEYDILHSGNMLFKNLLFNLIQENSREEESAQ